MASTLESPTSPQPSPPPGAEREHGGGVHPLRRAMDSLYRLCAIIAGSALDVT